MGKCAVKYCSNRSHKENKSIGITFHRIPADPERRIQWIKIIRLLRKETDWIPTKRTTICSKHFSDGDKKGPKKDGVFERLSKKAIPMLVDKPCAEGNATHLEDGCINMDDEMNDLETDEEMEEITKPIKYKMMQTINRLRRTSAERLKKIKRLMQRNNRLEKKNKKLQDLIEALKKNTS